jgi:hypothetical protein
MWSFLLLWFLPLTNPLSWLLIKECEHLLILCGCWWQSTKKRFSLYYLPFKLLPCISGLRSSLKASLLDNLSSKRPNCWTDLHIMYFYITSASINWNPRRKRTRRRRIEEEEEKKGPITRIFHPACDIRTQSSNTYIEIVPLQMYTL